MPPQPSDVAVSRVFAALMSGELGKEDLTARRLTAFLGQSTIVLYHHYGSLDGFLIRVDGMGWRRLLERLLQREAQGADGPDLAVAFLEFAFAHPALYWLMSERPFDRARLREEGRLSLDVPLWTAFSDVVERHGGRSPALDAQVLLAGLHGLASLTLSGRASLGGSDVPARASALAAARHLAHVVFRAPPAPQPPNPIAPKSNTSARERKRRRTRGPRGDGGTAA